MTLETWTVSEDGLKADNQEREGCSIECGRFCIDAGGCSRSYPLDLVAALLRAAGYMVVSPKALREIGK